VAVETGDVVLMKSALAMSASSITVVCNALLLRREVPAPDSAV
jgi:cation transport ATPase